MRAACIRVLEIWMRGRSCFVQVNGDGEAFPEERILYHDHCETVMPGCTGERSFMV